MEKEHKIAVSIALVFFIYGLSSWFSNGQFASPTFLKHFLYLPISIIVLVVYFKKANPFVLGGFSLMCLMGFLSDGFTMNLLAQKMESNILYDFSMSRVFALLFILFYFGYFVFLTFYWQKLNKTLALILLGLVAVVVGLNLFTHFEQYNQWLFVLALLGFVLIENRYNASDSITHKVVSAQLLLFLLMEIQQHLMLFFLAV